MATQTALAVARGGRAEDEARTQRTTGHLAKLVDGQLLDNDRQLFTVACGD